MDALTTTPAAEKVDTRQKVELAEGVAVHLRIAGPYPRIAAFLIDLCVRFGLMIAISMFLQLMEIGESANGNYITGLYLLIFFVIFWFYHILYEGGKKGATIGKRIIGLRVSSLSGGRITWGQALARNLLRFADIMPGFTYGVGLLSIFLSSRCQRLGDMVADTVVVHVPKKSKSAVWRGVTDNQSFADVPVVIPRFSLQKEEERAIVSFAERAVDWSPERRTELANLLYPLTEKKGAAGVAAIIGMARYIQEEK